MWELALLAVICFVQNAAFTWSGRSRTSGDPVHHAKAAIFSNGTYFVSTVFIWKNLWTGLTNGDYALIAATGLIYVAFTAAGSVAMMVYMLKTETGKQRVGAR